MSHRFLVTILCSVGLVLAQIPTSGLVAYYPFNGNANDSSGNGHNGVVKNGVTLTTDRFGNPNSAYYFSGINNGNNYIKINLGNQKSLTASLWINSDTCVNWYPQILSVDSGATRMEFLNQSGNHPSYISAGIVGLIGSYPDNVETPHPVSFKAWHHIVVTHDHSQGIHCIYVDNQLVVSKATTGYLNMPVGIICIGNTYDGLAGDQNGGYKGKLDDIRFYNRALSQAEVTALFNEGAGVAISQTVGGFSGSPASFSVDSTFNSVSSSFNTSVFSSIDTLYLCYEIANLSYLTQRPDMPASYTVNVGTAVTDFGNNISTGTFSKKAVNITALKSFSANFQIQFKCTGGAGEIIFADPYLLVYGAKSTTGSLQKSILRPQALMKASAFPNPTRSAVTINYSVLMPSYIDASIFKANGDLVKIVFRGLRQQGTYNYVWDGRDISGFSVANGNYFFRVHVAGGQEISEQILVLK